MTIDILSTEMQTKIEKKKSLSSKITILFFHNM